jgi:hypothetical protein
MEFLGKALPFHAFEKKAKMTVNQPSYDFEGSSPSSPTNLFNNL